MEEQSAGSKYVEGDAVVDHFAAAVSDSAVESTLQVKQVEVEVVSVTPVNPDPTNTEEEAAAVDTVPEPAVGLIHFDRWDCLKMLGGWWY